MVLFLHQPTLLHLLLSLFFFFFLVGWFCLVLFWVMFSILCPDRNFNECKTKALVPSWAQWMNQVGVCLRSPAYWQFFVPLWPKCWSVWPVTREACFQKILDIFKIYIYICFMDGIEVKFTKPLSKSETFLPVPCFRLHRSRSRNQPEKTSALDSNS